MFKRSLSLVLTAVSLSLVPTASAYPQSPASSEPTQAQSVKKRIIKHGIGKKARVEVTLTDNRRIKGYTSGIAEDHFVVVNTKTNDVTTIPYEQVEKLKTKKPSPLIPLAFLGGTLGGLMLLVSLSLRGS